VKIHEYCIYIITDKSNTVLYIGVTSDLQDRVWQHKQKYLKVLLQSMNVINWFIMKNINGYKMLLAGKSN